MPKNRKPYSSDVSDEARLNALLVHMATASQTAIDKSFSGLDGSSVAAVGIEQSRTE